MNQTSTTQQGLIKHGGLHSTTGAHGMRAHNSNKTADHHVRHSRNNNLNFRLAREQVGDIKISAKLCATPSQEISIFSVIL